MAGPDSLLNIHIDLGPRSYDIRFEALDALPAHLRSLRMQPGRCLLITDENVAELYGGSITKTLISHSWHPVVVTLPVGETTKSSENLRRIYDVALPQGIDRGTPVLALGGGVVGDLAGFAAATLLRGLPLVQIPTTLVAQVDSAIGGKTGINHPAGKNLIGAFHQPRLVHADPEVLLTLPRREWTSGLAEVVKHALIADESFFGFLEERWDEIAARDRQVVRPVVHRAAAVKARIVEQDEREAGLRSVLNFGHTFAHAIERTAGYGAFTHGEAVAVGMRAALHLSHRLRGDFAPTRPDRLVARIPVPPGLPSLDLHTLIAAMQTDKKALGGRLRFVLLDRIGHAYLTDQVDLRDVEAAWQYALTS